MPSWRGGASAIESQEMQPGALTTLVKADSRPGLPRHSWLITVEQAQSQDRVPPWCPSGVPSPTGQLAAGGCYRLGEQAACEPCGRQAHLNLMICRGAEAVLQSMQHLHSRSEVLAGAGPRRGDPRPSGVDLEPPPPPADPNEADCKDGSGVRRVA